MANQNFLAFPRASQSVQPNQNASLGHLPANVLRTIISYVSQLSNPLTVVVRAGYYTNEDEAIVIMHDASQNLASYQIEMPEGGHASGKKALIGHNPIKRNRNVDGPNSPKSFQSIIVLNKRIRDIVVDHVHDRPLILAISEDTFSKGLRYGPENRKRYKRELKSEMKRLMGDEARKATLAVQVWEQEWEKYFRSLDPEEQKKEERKFYRWNPILPNIKPSRTHYLHIKVGESRHDWYWMAIARSIFALWDQRIWFNHECPEYFLLEFEERKNKHSIQPNGRYDKDVLREEEPGFQYRDQQFKDYERTVKLLRPWLKILAGRVWISFPHWMQKHGYSKRVHVRLGHRFGYNIIFRPFAEDGRFNRVWSSGGSLFFPTTLGQRSQNNSSGLDFDYDSGGESGGESSDNDEVHDDEPDAPSDKSVSEDERTDINASDEDKELSEDESEDGEDASAVLAPNPDYRGPNSAQVAEDDEEVDDESESEDDDLGQDDTDPYAENALAYEIEDDFAYGAGDEFGYENDDEGDIEDNGDLPR